MKNVDWKDVALRSFKTFCETAFFYLIAAFTDMNPFSGEHDDMAWFGLFLSAGAAGVAAVWNGVLAPLFPKKNG